MFWILFLEILRITKPTGLIYINVPSNGPFHRYPVDCWRFYPDSGNALVTWAKRNQLNPMLLESYTDHQDLDYWNDFVAVFLKDQSFQHLHTDRMLKKKRDFSNGLVSTGGEILNRRGHPQDQRNVITWLRKKYWELVRSVLRMDREPSAR